MTDASPMKSAGCERKRRQPRAAPNASHTILGDAPRLLAPGGDRWTGRASDRLSEREVAALFLAAAVAVDMGLQFNRFLTVHWSALGIDDRRAGAATQDLLRRIRDWLRDHGCPAAWCWVRENDEGDGSKGSHVHICMHLPGDLRAALLRGVQRWARLSAGARVAVAGAVRSRGIGTLGCEASSPATHRVNLANVLAYVSKGASHEARAAIAGGARAISPDFDLERVRHGEGGRIIGKRSGVSRVLSQR